MALDRLAVVSQGIQEITKSPGDQIGEGFGAVLGSASAKFRELAGTLVSVVGRDGIRLVAYSDPQLPYFSALPPEAQEAVLNALGNYITVAETTQKHGFSVRDSKALTWRMLKHLGLTPLSNAFDYVEPTDFLEIYGNHHQLVFASINYLDISSYSLEDLYCRPWMELYSRDVGISGRLLCAANRLLSGEINGNLFLGIPPHEVSETGGRRQTGIVEPKLFSPLFAHGRPAGLLCRTIVHRVF